MSIEQTPDINMPSDPVILKKIRDCMFELSASKTRTEGERAFQTEAISALAKEVEIPKKFLRKMANIYHKNSRDVVEGEQESTIALYDRVFDKEI